MVWKTWKKLNIIFKLQLVNSCLAHNLANLGFLSDCHNSFSLEKQQRDSMCPSHLIQFYQMCIMWSTNRTTCVVIKNLWDWTLLEQNPWSPPTLCVAPHIWQSDWQLWKPFYCVAVAMKVSRALVITSAECYLIHLVVTLSYQMYFFFYSYLSSGGKFSFFFPVC